MLIYMHGKSEGSENYDLKVPPIILGFMIPEVAIGSIKAVAAMFTASGLFAYKKKYTPTKLAAANLNNPLLSDLFW